MGNLRVVYSLVAVLLFASRFGLETTAAAGEAADPLPFAPEVPVEPAPPRTTEEAIASFQIGPGFRLENVAAEPLVEAPVSIAFDPDGRLWVVEMPGFMPNLEGTGEDAPTGRVVVLEDSDGNGRMDTRTVFLDGLVLPRSVAFVDGGVLIAAPPQLLFCRDENRDLRCDTPEIVARDYGTGRNPEHDANGLIYGLDNWLYSANLGARHRFSGGRWQTESTVSRGQWGIAQDDFGRLFYNTNTLYLLGDQLPVYVPEAHVRGTRGLNAEIDPDRTTWPARANIGVNRGYREETLRGDKTLAEFTAACGPHVYRGDQFPEAFRGNVFVAEPAGNFVRRSVLTENGEHLAALNGHEQSEFLTSTDERFRPVSLATGPDGALYIVDMYRGLIQHRIYLTPYLKDHIRRRGLDRPLDRGRIWRVVSSAGPLGARPQLSHASLAALLSALTHPNGWWRDTAQRLLVERADRAAVPQLQQLLEAAPDPRTRLHALFVLDGLEAVNRAALDRAARDAHRFVRAAASGLRARESITALSSLAAELAAHPRLGPLDGRRVRGRELDLVARMLNSAAWESESAGRAALLQRLATRVTGTGRQEQTTRLLELVAAEPPGAQWRQVALLKGVAAAKRGVRTRRLAIPEGWAKLTRAKDPEVRRTALALDPWVTGRVGPAPAPWPLSAPERLRFTRGKAQYAAICGACHHPSGIGEEGKAPPLVDSTWVTGPAERLVRIVLQGLRGPVRVRDRIYKMEMPSMGALEDAEVAELLTYVRNEADWGHGAGPVDTATVAHIRRDTAARKDPWTSPELLAISAVTAGPAPQR